MRFVARLANGNHGLQYLGPTLRGAFGYLLKAIVCQVKHGRCHECPLRGICPYPAIFEGRPPEDRAVMRKYPAIPQPFVLDVAGPGAWDGEPDELRFGIRLFGATAQWTPYIVETFRRMGEIGLGAKRIPFVLLAVAQGDRTVWARGEDVVSKVDPAPVDTSARAPDGTIRWQFVTPVHLEEPTTRGDATVDPLKLILAGRRRRFLLEAFYGSGATEETPASFVDAAEFRVVSSSLQTWRIRRFSGRQQRSVPLAGVVGEMTVAGPWSRAGDWMSSVEHTHVGKYSTFGFGRVRWEVVQ
ncbi:MAG: CRISPR system precrRNA processing endoribonuclease RAMP protein Cas6 [Phycisphaerales bacterium]